MFGKHFRSMYKGSMYGAGPLTFAVWGYIIAHMEPDSQVGAQVELNPIDLKNTIGTNTVEEIEEVIRKLCAPDPNSRSKEDEGRRLRRVGQFAYIVVNGKKYTEIKKNEDRREAGRIRQARYRENHPEKFKRGPKQNVSMAERNQMEADKRIAQQEDGSTDE